MILLDTNIISEPLRPKPDSAVIAWLDRQPVETLDLLRKYSSHCINQPRNQICP